ncbi:MAG: hypothetical protein CL607_02155 [Anaerolineaceae bacterium]|nr:hypothetical protein [Anaerolineaceae bacterium]
MPIKWRWYDAQQRVILFTFLKLWTTEEFYEANANASEAAQEHQHVIDVIYDVTAISIAPRNSISNTVNMLRTETWQPYKGAAIVVGAGPGVRMIIHVAKQVLPKGMLYLAKDMDHAMRIVQEQQARRLDES